MENLTLPKKSSPVHFLSLYHSNNAICKNALMHGKIQSCERISEYFALKTNKFDFEISEDKLM